MIFFLFLISSSPLFAFDLEGEIKVKPPFPSPEVLEIAEKHRAECGEKKISPKLKISPDGGVANAVVKIEVGAGLSAPTNPIVPTSAQFVLDQINCEFSPHVLLIPKGAAVQIKNSEAMLHNVRAFDEKATMLFNDAMPKKGQVLKKHFNDPGKIIVRCGVHPWMHAMVAVQEHPYYALTDEAGRFKIEGIPDGNYTLSVWHESLGEIRAEVSPETKTLELVYLSR